MPFAFYNKFSVALFTYLQCFFKAALLKASNMQSFQRALVLVIPEEHIIWGSIVLKRSPKIAAFEMASLSGPWQVVHNYPIQ